MTRLGFYEIADLVIYPVKSCRGIHLREMTFDALGPSWDRRFMVVDAAGRFITQRQRRELGLVHVELTRDTLRLSRSGAAVLDVPLEGRAEPTDVTVWRFSGRADDQGSEAAAWFSDLLEEPCRLVRVSGATDRTINPKYAPTPTPLGFADGYPALLIGEASLDDLSARVGQPLEMSRFRPNVVVRGAPAYAEDNWASLEAGSVTLDIVKPCDRCVVTTIAPGTLETSKEPLRTLAGYRNTEQGVVFGQNCIHRAPGSISVGDVVQALEKKSE
jgi:uncharacterized protein YcbX